MDKWNLSCFEFFGRQAKSAVCLPHRLSAPLINVKSQAPHCTHSSVKSLKQNFLTNTHSIGKEKRTFDLLRQERSWKAVFSFSFVFYWLLLLFLQTCKQLKLRIDWEEPLLLSSSSSKSKVQSFLLASWELKPHEIVASWSHSQQHMFFPQNKLFIIVTIVVVVGDVIENDVQMWMFTVFYYHIENMHTHPISRR